MSGMRIVRLEIFYSMLLNALYIGVLEASSADAAMEDRVIVDDDPGALDTPVNGEDAQVPTSAHRKPEDNEQGTELKEQEILKLAGEFDQISRQNRQYLSQLSVRNYLDKTVLPSVFEGLKLLVKERYLQSVCFGDCSGVC